MEGAGPKILGTGAKFKQVPCQKNCRATNLKQTSAENVWIGSLGPRMFWGTRATNFSIYTTKMEGAGPTILGTRTKFKRVPCQKNCRVNRALV